MNFKREGEINIFELKENLLLDKIHLNKSLILFNNACLLEFSIL